MVRSLLEAGANKDPADVNWRTPMHVAAENGHHEVEGTLLEADTNKEDPADVI